MSAEGLSVKKPAAFLIIIPLEDSMSITGKKVKKRRLKNLTMQKCEKTLHF
jgi:hypothetical protein